MFVCFPVSSLTLIITRQSNRGYKDEDANGKKKERDRNSIDRRGAQRE
jgi:hypothetical protein